VEKTSVYLTESERRRLVHLARTTGRSQAAIIREAIAAYDPDPRGDRSFALTGVADGPEDAIADVAEEELLAGFGE
jgi:predicted DNA-binding protein